MHRFGYGRVCATIAAASVAAFMIEAAPGAGAAVTTQPVTTARITGQTAAGTAASALFSAFPYANGDCPGIAGDRPVVLAGDAAFPQALSAGYLAGWLKTGILFTSPGSLTASARSALAREGISHVYVVGDAQAVSTADVRSVESMPVTACGGGPSTGANIEVTRIAGPTAPTTAADVALTPNRSFVGRLNLTNAYAVSSQYNATSGESAAPTPLWGALPTAILVTNHTYRDAESASVLAVANHLPLLVTTVTTLSPGAAKAIVTLGIRQVILVGGELAISTAVLTKLESLGQSVLRVAGATYAQTATELASFELASSIAQYGPGWNPTGGITVAQGASFTDGIAGAVVAAQGVGGSGPEPMLLTRSLTSIGAPLTSFLNAAGLSGIDNDGKAVRSLTVLGGPTAVSAAQVTAMETDLQG